MAGVSFRVAKGVTLRTGGYKGQPVYADVTGTFSGEFVLTNKRLMFIHGQQGFESTLATLGAIMDTEDGKMMIQKGNNTCILHLVISLNEKKGKASVIEGASSLVKEAISLMRESDGALLSPEPTARINESEINTHAASIADEIAKFKKLLDDGVITQDEFDAKKRQLLDL